MRRLLPAPVADVDVYDAVRPPPGRWARVGFVASLDGAIVDAQGRSGGLGGPGDLAVFRALRAHADLVVVGAGTARTERYGPHVLAPPLAAQRAGDGRATPAAIVLVTRSLDLDPADRVFAEAVTPTIVLTCATAPADRRAALSEVARVVVAGDAAVDLAAGLGLLAAEGAVSVVCEGGPSLAGAMFAAGLVDELCLTVAPTLTGGGGPRIVERLPGCVALRLTRILVEGDELLLGYTRPEPL